MGGLGHNNRIHLEEGKGKEALLDEVSSGIAIEISPPPPSHQPQFRISHLLWGPGVRPSSSLV